MDKFYSLFTYTFATFGLCYIIGHAKISQAARETFGAYAVRMHEQSNYRRALVLVKLLELIQCPACLGFWVGFAIGFTPYAPLQPVLLALYTCGVNFIIGRATGLI